MPEDRTVLTADGSQYFDVLQRAGVAADRLGASGARVGEGFLRGERVIRTATANIAASFAMGGDAASTALIAMQGLERVFKIGVGPTIAVAAGVAVFEAVHKQIEKTQKAYDDLKEDLEKPVDFGMSEQSAANAIEATTKKMKDLSKESDTFGGRFARSLSKLTGLAAVLGLRSGLIRTGTLEAATDIAPIGPKAVDEVLKSGAAKVKTSTDILAQRISEGANKLHQSLADAIERFRGSTGNLFRDIGSGQFLRNLEQQRLENQQTAAGQELVREFEEDLARGVNLGPNATAIVNAARAAAAKGGVGIQDILNADFSNLNLLSKYDFSGLAPLANMTIIIQ